jgi:hypothetical protein
MQLALMNIDMLNNLQRLEPPLAGLVLAFNLFGQQQWRNQDMGRLHTFKENHFQILDGGSFSVSNLYEQGQRTIQVGLRISYGRYTHLLELMIYPNIQE